MLEPAIPCDESARQAALDGTLILDTGPEERFDRYTRLARRIFGVEIALVCLVDRGRQWFKSHMGLDISETSRDVSFCGHAIIDPDQILIIENAANDNRFHDNPLVTDSPNIRFYAGCPIKTPDGHPIGTLCIIDARPRQFSGDDLESLRDLGAMVMGELVALRMATIDDLTGLSNRRAFQMLADQALSMCRRSDKTASLLMIDLDGFKDINDQLGHACGDKALIEFSAVMSDVFRESDVVARIGGDEFSVLFTESDAEHTMIAVNRLSSAVEAVNSLPDRQHRLSFSVGIVEFDAVRHATTSELMDEADQLMYECKRSKTSTRLAESVHLVPAWTSA